MSQTKRVVDIRRRARHQESEPHLLGESIAQYRVDRDLTQVRVAELMDTGHGASWVSYVERGCLRRLPSWPDWRALCRTIGADPVALLVDCGYLTRREVLTYASRSLRSVS